MSPIANDWLVNSAIRPTLMRWLDRWVPPPLLARIAPYYKFPISAETWDHQYESGEWDYLYGLEQLSRYSIIAGLCQFLKPSGHVLDVCCGNGVLAKRLSGTGTSFYFGIDLSAVAIEQAQREDLPAAEFLVADAATFEPPRDFDLIVFNGALYYLNDPERHAERYARSLRPEGLLIVIQWPCARSLQIWKRLEERFETVDGVYIMHKPSQKAWDVAVLKPR
jgi:SAM-dependent methyltransferase